MKIISDFFDLSNKEFLKKIGFLEWCNSEKNPAITGLEYDSRNAMEGSLYFALPGLHTDGRRFIPQALARGAKAVVYQGEQEDFGREAVCIRVKDARYAMSGIADAFYGSPSKNLVLIGVTGTEGKSTTVYLIWQLLRLMEKKAGFVSTVQYCVKDEAEWNPEHQTTPEATVIHRRLAEMRDNGLEFAVLESSSHGLSPKTNRLGDAAFDIAIMTNVTHEHLEFHGTWEQYRDDKANLFRALDQAEHSKVIAGETREIPSFGVVNADDNSAAFFKDATQKSVFSYTVGGAPSNVIPDISLAAIQSSAVGNSYDIWDKRTGEIIHIEDKLPGAFNAKNVMAGLLCVSSLLSAPISSFAPLIPHLLPVRGRMTAVCKGQPFEVVVDYAHTPSSFETIFPPLRERLDKNGGKIIALFGSAGDRDTQKRALQGRITARYADFIVLTDEDPRGEEPLAILKEIAAGVYQNAADKDDHRQTWWEQGKNLFLIPDRPSAIQKAFSLAKTGDLVLLLGKGHENSIIYADKTLPYDEIAEAEKALAMIFT